MFTDMISNFLLLVNMPEDMSAMRRQLVEGEYSCVYMRQDAGAETETEKQKSQLASDLISEFWFLQAKSEAKSGVCCFAGILR